MIHVETRGSHVFIDETEMTYQRLPKTEQPRERPEWSDERAGPLQDAVKHPFLSWRIGAHPLHADGDNECVGGGGISPVRLSCGHCPGLMITYPTDSTPGTTWFPNATIKEQS